MSNALQDGLLKTQVREEAAALALAWFKQHLPDYILSTDGKTPYHEHLRERTWEQYFCWLAVNEIVPADPRAESASFLWRADPYRKRRQAAEHHRGQIHA